MMDSMPPTPELPVGKHRLELQLIRFEKRETMDITVATFTVLESETVETGAPVTIRNFMPKHEVEDPDTGEHFMVWSLAAQFGAARVKALVIAAEEGVVNPPADWETDEHDQDVVHEMALDAMTLGQRHIVDVEITTATSKGRRPTTIPVYKWSAVPHRIAPDNGAPELA